MICREQHFPLCLQMYFSFLPKRMLCRTFHKGTKQGCPWGDIRGRDQRLARGVFTTVRDGSVIGSDFYNCLFKTEKWSKKKKDGLVTDRQQTHKLFLEIDWLRHWESEYFHTMGPLTVSCHFITAWPPRNQNEGAEERAERRLNMPNQRPENPGNDYCIAYSHVWKGAVMVRHLQLPGSKRGRGETAAVNFVCTGFHPPILLHLRRPNLSPQSRCFFFCFFPSLIGPQWHRDLQKTWLSKQHSVW